MAYHVNNHQLAFGKLNSQTLAMNTYYLSWNNSSGCKVGLHTRHSQRTQYNFHFK